MRQRGRASRVLPLLLLLLLPVLLSGSADGVRRKRFVAFRKGSNMIYRLNYKVNTLAYTTIFAHASGFKVAWALPTMDQQQQRQRQQRRSSGNDGGSSSASLRNFRESAALVYESHGFDGEMCLLKSLCQAMDYVRLKDGVLMRLLGLLAGSRFGGNSSSTMDPLVCDKYASTCPLHLIGLGTFLHG